MVFRYNINNTAYQVFPTQTDIKRNIYKSRGSFKTRLAELTPENKLFLSNLGFSLKK